MTAAPMRRRRSCSAECIVAMHQKYSLLRSQHVIAGELVTQEMPSMHLPVALVE